MSVSRAPSRLDGVQAIGGPALVARLRRIRAASRRARMALGVRMRASEEGQALWRRVAAEPFWFHSIDLGHGIVTPGVKTLDSQARELAALRLPDLAGRSVLDIGAWDGAFSFAAEQRGARRVVALDRWVWAIDFEKKERYKAECRARGVPPQPYDRIESLWDFAGLPGKRGFDLAHEALGSRVEPMVADLMTVDLEALGSFDVVLFLGVLYHLENPLLALGRLRRLTAGMAVIETEAVVAGGFEDRAFCEFFPIGAKLAGDPTNFWAPSAPALVAMAQTAGFARVEVLTPPPPAEPGQIARYRLVAHAFA